VSYGSLYGGNSMLAQKWFGLDWASVLAYREGWMAEHCAIITLVDPDHHKFHIAAIFPSACGKSAFALQIPKIPGMYRVMPWSLLLYHIPMLLQDGQCGAFRKTWLGFGWVAMGVCMPPIQNLDSLV